MANPEDQKSVIMTRDTVDLRYCLTDNLAIERIG